MSIAKRLLSDSEMRDDSVVLDLSEMRIEIRSNSRPLLDRLRRYFAHVIDQEKAVEGAGSRIVADTVVHVVEAPATDLGLRYVDWRREPGKIGRKDAYHDLSDGRLVRKLRTGMLFLQRDVGPVAYGPCLANDNQVINFVNCQYMNRLQRRGALICHAAGVAAADRGLAIAGFSGGGKSSLMLRLLEQPGVRFLTNDRLFLSSASDDEVLALGIPKLPRVNPGTILSLSTMHQILDARKRESLASLPPDQLWTLEEKYDVDVSAVYGSDRIVSQAPLSDLLVLNWQRDSGSVCQINRVDLNARPDLLGAITKSPGPFYADEDGVFRTDQMTVEHRPYLERLENVNLWEASGTLDFALAAQHCLDRLRADRCTKTF
jgi:HprK-related kinase B